MKALSFYQPWATLVVTGEKKIETRSWKPSNKIFNEIFGKTIAIHASKNFPKWAKDLIKTERFFGSALSAHGYKDRLHFADVEQLPLGAIIGTIEIIALRETQNIIRAYEFEPHLFQMLGVDDFSEKEKAFGDYSPNRFGWFLRNPKILKNPIPCRGALSLWEVPEEIEAKILAENYEK